MSIYINEENWVYHNIQDLNDNPVIGLDYRNISCMFWTPLFTNFQTKYLTIDDVFEADAGNYGIFYYPEEVTPKGYFISFVYSSTGLFLPSLEVTTAVDTVSGTCAVTGQCIDIQGQVLTEPVQITVENIYNPIRTSFGSIVERKNVFYSDISGSVEMSLMRGATVRVGISHFGITKTVTIPDSDYADLFKLIENADSAFEPL